MITRSRLEAKVEPSSVPRRFRLSITIGTITDPRTLILLLSGA